MSTPDTTQQGAQSVEDTAHETANALLRDSFAVIGNITPAREIGTAEAILVAAHVIAAKLDATETTHLEAMRDLQESLDYLGAQGGRESASAPTAHESEVMYRALEEDYLTNHKAASIDEMDAALRRFNKLAGR